MSAWAKWAIVVLWGLTIASSISQVCCMPFAGFPRGFSTEMALVILFMPIVFFTAFGLLASHSPFYSPALAKWINARKGENWLESFLVQLRPILMFAASAVVLGIGLIIKGYFHKEPGAVLVGGFFLSGAAGFTFAHIILRRKGAKGV